MTTISVKGTIAPADYAWFYEMLGLEHTTAEQFRAQLDAATDGVVVEINSPGGYVTAASEIYDAIRAYEGEIECRVTGQAASAASVIACAAESSISPMGTLFLHNCLGGAEGNQRDMRAAAQMLASVDENIMNAYRDKTGLADTELYRLMERDTTLSAQRAVELGFIDRVTESAGDAMQTTRGAVSGIAAAAPGFIDPMAMDADRLAAMRALYLDCKDATCEGGEEMNTEEIAEVEEEAIEAGEAEEAATETGAEGEEAQAGADEAAAEGAEPEAEADAGEAEPEGEPEAGEPEDAARAYQAGMLAERERIAAIMDIAGRVPEAMVKDALFANPVTAAELALSAMKAEGGQRASYLSAARADVEASGSADVLADVAKAPGESAKDEQRQKLAEAYSKRLSK